MNLFLTPALLTATNHNSSSPTLRSEYFYAPSMAMESQVSSTRRYDDITQGAAGEREPPEGGFQSHPEGGEGLQLGH